MRYVRKADACNIDNMHKVGNIHVTGSVRGMQTLYGWPKGGQVRVGAWIYNIGPNMVERLRRFGLIRGE